MRPNSAPKCSLNKNAAQALAALPDLRRADVAATAVREYNATLNDIEAMAQLGLYYAKKTRGACELALFDKTGKGEHQSRAVAHLEAALDHWKHYAEAYTRQYVQPVLYNRSRIVDIPAQTADAAADVAMARHWKPGTIDESRIKRSPTEAGPL